MRAVGIITEYNPFHAGHIIHLNESRRVSEADIVVCVMSPDFVQRGEPAIIDKYSRAKMAVLGGADIVVELPTSAALSSAEGFAASAVAHLNELRVSGICFGSEASDIELLSDIADILIDEPHNFKEILRTSLRGGSSYAKARQEAAASCAGEAAAKVLDKPNNLLGIEYIKAIKKNSFDIKPYCIKRTGAGYNDTDIASSDIPSASAIRLAYGTGREKDINIPEFTRQIIGDSKCFPITFNHFGQMFYFGLETLLSYVNFDKSAFISELAEVSDLSAETAARIYAVYTQSMTSGRIYTLEEFALAVKTKQFALSRIKRNIMRFILNLDTQARFCAGKDTADINILSSGKDTSDINILSTGKGTSEINKNIPCKSKGNAQNVSCLRVLGFNKKGQEYISSIKEELSVPLITNVAQYKEIYVDEIHAHNIYRQVCMNTYGNAPLSDFVAKPFMM